MIYRGELCGHQSHDNWQNSEESGDDPQFESRFRFLEATELCLKTDTNDTWNSVYKNVSTIICINKLLIQTITSTNKQYYSCIKHSKITPYKPLCYVHVIFSGLVCTMLAKATSMFIMLVTARTSGRTAQESGTVMSKNQKSPSVENWEITAAVGGTAHRFKMTAAWRGNKRNRAEEIQNKLEKYSSMTKIKTVTTMDAYFRKKNKKCWPNEINNIFRIKKAVNL